MREEERKCIAREVHDQMGQMLTVLKMDISLMSEYMRERLSGEVLEYFNDESTKIIDRIDTIMKSVQHITAELRPEILETLGLVKAMRWQAQEYKKRTDLNFKFNIKLRKVDFLDKNQSTALFRIFQEAMINIIRHAKATEVNIVLQSKNDHIHFVVSDDGIGITDEQRESTSSLGIIGMRERSRILGGNITIERIAKEGTRIELHIPLNKAAKAQLIK